MEANLGENAATPQTNEANNGEQTPQTNEYVTKKDIAEMVSRSIQAELRRSRKTESNPAPVVQTTETEPATVRQQIEKLQAEIKADREALTKERRDTAITSAIANHGLDSDNAEMLEALIERKFGKGIKVEGKAVIYEDDVTGDKLGIGDFVSNFLKEKGDKFKAPIAAPTKNVKTTQTQRGNGIIPLLNMNDSDRQSLSADEAKKQFRAAYANLGGQRR